MRCIIPIPVEIVFRDMPRWTQAEDLIRDKAAGLERFFEKILGCRVVVEAPHRHSAKGQHYLVRIDLTVPGREIVVDRDPAGDPRHEDLYIAIRDAFKAAGRQLQDYARERRGQTKHHEAPPRGRVTKLFPADGYGFLETPDGREVYFHRHAVADDAFDHLVIGCDVRFHEEAGERGPQASSVRPIGRA